MTQSFYVVIEPITAALLRIAQDLSTAHGLLTNDSLIAAAMQSLALTDLASNDPDLSVMPGLTVWRPQP
jgi:predicted nucleic acid-binding protein